MASSPYPPTLHAEPASFSKDVAMSCTAAIPSSHVFSPSGRSLSCKAASASPEFVFVSSQAHAAGTPLQRPLHTQIPKELPRGVRTIPARRQPATAPHLRLAPPLPRRPASGLHLLLQRWPAHLISLEFAFQCDRRPHFDRQPPTLGLPATVGWFCWHYGEAGELRSRGLNNRHP